METVRRQALLAGELRSTHVAIVANKVRDATDRAAIAELAERLGLAVVGQVPYSAEVADADRADRSVVDYAGEGVVVHAIDQLIGDASWLRQTLDTIARDLSIGRC